MIWPFWRHFRPKLAILAAFATFLVLGTSKFEIYMKKQSRIRREMTPLGGVRGGPICRLDYYSLVIFWYSEGSLKVN